MIGIRLQRLKDAVHSARGRTEGGKTYSKRVLDRQIALGGGIHPKSISDINRNPKANITLKTLNGLITFFFNELKDPASRRILHREKFTPKECSERELLLWIITELFDIDLESITSKGK